MSTEPDLLKPVHGNVDGYECAQQAEWRIAELEGVEDVNVELVYDPPWTPDMITEDGKKSLGLD